MANIGFSSGRPLMANAKPAMQKPYPAPGGRPPTDFGGGNYTPAVEPSQAGAFNDLMKPAVMPPSPGNGMMFGEGVNVAPNPVTRGGRPTRPPTPDQTLGVPSAPAINDLAPGGTVARPPRPTGGLTATRPYDPNRRRFGLRDPGGR